MDIRNLFGANLRRLRKSRDLSQARLSVAMGVDRAHVSLMELGRQNVTLTTLWAAAVALDAHPSELLAPMDDAAAKAEGTGADDAGQEDVASDDPERGEDTSQSDGATRDGAMRHKESGVEAPPGDEA